MNKFSSRSPLKHLKRYAVQAEIQIIKKKVLAAGKVLATTTGTWDQAQNLFQRGYQMLMLMADGGALAALSTQKVKQFREQYPNGERVLLSNTKLLSI
jgi:2-keto-3-deoxy-L-rhamnonate aldolase RhmA